MKRIFSIVMALGLCVSLSVSVSAATVSDEMYAKAQEFYNSDTYKSSKASFPYVAVYSDGTYINFLFLSSSPSNSSTSSFIGYKLSPFNTNSTSLGWRSITPYFTGFWNANQLTFKMTDASNYAGSGYYYTYLPEFSNCKLGSAVSLPVDFTYIKPVPVNSTPLQDLVASAKSKDSNLYTSQSWANLQDKITQSETLLAGSSYTQADIDNAVVSLQNALSSLVLKPVIIPDPEPEPDGGGLDIGEYNYLVEGFRLQDLLPAQTAIFDQVKIAKGLGLWIWVILFSIFVVTRIIHKFISSDSISRNQNSILNLNTFNDSSGLKMNMQGRSITKKRGIRK